MSDPAGHVRDGFEGFDRLWTPHRMAYVAPAAPSAELQAAVSDRAVTTAASAGSTRGKDLTTPPRGSRR